VDYDTASAEQQRIGSLLESNQHYSFLTLLGATFDEYDQQVPDGYWVGVGWRATVEDQDYGNMLALWEPGESIEAIRRAVHHNYLHTMAHR